MIIKVPAKHSAARLNAAMQSHIPEPVAVFLDELATMYANNAPVKGLYRDEYQEGEGEIIMLAIPNNRRFAQVLAYFSAGMTLEEQRAGDPTPIFRAIRAFAQSAAAIYRKNAETAADADEAEAA